MPSAIYSSPDGSCFLTSNVTDGNWILRAFHWSTFGTSEGIVVNLSQDYEDSLVLTSLVNRSTVHLMSLDVPGQKCHSVALDITRRTTEYMFKEKEAQHTTNNSQGSITLHNCLVDCYSEVWTRFPVVPAVHRQTFVSSARLGKTVRFITESHHEAFASHFAEMIQSFEKQT